MKELDLFPLDNTNIDTLYRRLLQANIKIVKHTKYVITIEDKYPLRKISNILRHTVIYDPLQNQDTDNVAYVWSNHDDDLLDDISSDTSLYDDVDNDE